MQTPKRFYIFTGKGGVGKTTLSLSFTKYMHDCGYKVRYVYFKSGSLNDNPIELKQGQMVAQALGMDFMGLDLRQSATDYVAKKLKSPTIAKWIVSTTFFKALINMIPGFNYLIYLGQILQDLENDPNLYIVLDSPSSGHTLTMMEATHNFRDIFKNGIIFDDTNRMLNFLYKPGITQMNIITLPGQLAINEAIELQQEVIKSSPIKINIYLNNTLGPHLQQMTSPLPHFLKQKREAEKIVLESNAQKIANSITHSLANTQKDQVLDLAESMTKLV